MTDDTLYLLRRLLSNQHTLTSAEFREELTKIVGEAYQQEAQEPYAYAVYFPDQPTVELVHDLDELTDDLTNREHQIIKLYAAPQPAVQQGADFAELQRLADCCPELNERNYDQDDVEELNAWAVEVAQCIDRTLATHPAAPVTQSRTDDEREEDNYTIHRMGQMLAEIGRIKP